MLGLDLRGPALAVNWAYYREFCPNPDTGDFKSNALYSEIRVVSRGSRSKKLAGACLANLPSVALLGGWIGDDIVYTLSDMTSGPEFRNLAYRHQARGREPRVLLGSIGSPRVNVVSVSADGDRLALATRDAKERAFVARIKEAHLPSR